MWSNRQKEIAMNRLIRYILVGFVILVLGLGLGFGLRIGVGSVASAQEGPLIDGQPQADLDGSTLEQETTVSVPMASAVVYKMYWANEFLSTHSDLTYASYGSTLYALAIPGGGFSFKLPLDLPNGVQVTSIMVYFVDNNSTYNMSFQLYRINPATAAQVELDSISTSGMPTSPDVQYVTVTGTPITVINNVDYAYTIRYAPVIVGSSHAISGVRVGYQYPAVGYLPLVNK